MIEVRSTSRWGGWLAVSISAVLAASALVFLLIRMAMALGGEDVDKYESPLMLSVARQLVVGPWELYGPFGGSNPLVLIHAPLYYRVGALAAWPIALAGMHHVEAARVAGRLISALGLVATLVAAYRLGRLGGLPPRSGWWSALLVASAPVLAGQPFAVRPDMAGVALQSWGVVLVLEAICQRDRSVWRLTLGSTVFGLAACVKQHLVGAWAVSAGLAAMGLSRGRHGPGALARVVLPGMSVVVVVYGAEWLVTDGRIWGSAFVAAGYVRRIHPGDWMHVATVGAAMIGKSAGLAALAVAGVSAARRGSGGWIRAVAILLVASIVALAVAQLGIPHPWVTGLLAVAALAALIVALTGSVVPMRRSGDVGRIDVALSIYCAAELIVMVVLCRSSSGAWINYGIQAVLFAAVLTARSLARSMDAMSGLGRAITALSAVAVLASTVMDAKVESSRRRAEHAALARVSAATGLPQSVCYFADRPGLNRMSGRLEWVYDDWLYPVFESQGLAEPRARWLGPVLGSPAAVRAIVLESDSLRVEGIPTPLPALGYAPAGRFESFRLWTRDAPSPHHSRLPPRR